MTKQEAIEKLHKLERVLNALPDDVRILHFQGDDDDKYDCIQLFGGDSVCNLGDKIPFGEFKDGRKCIKHSRCIEGVETFFLEVAQHE